MLIFHANISLHKCWDAQYTKLKVDQLKVSWDVVTRKLRSIVHYMRGQGLQNPQPSSDTRNIDLGQKGGSFDTTPRSPLF